MAALAMNGGYVSTNQRTTATPRDVYPTFFWLKPTVFPVLTVAMSHASQLPVGQVMYETMEDVLLPRRIVLDNNDKYTGAANTTTFTPALNTGKEPGDATWFQVGDRWRNHTKGELLKVTAVAGGVVSLQLDDNGVGGNITAASASDRFEYFDHPMEQGGLIQTPLSTVPQFPYNYTQLFSTPYGVTDSLQATKLYTGKEISRQEFQKMYQHKYEMEQTSLYGSRYQTTGAENLVEYHTAGLVNTITTNVDTFTTGKLDYATFNNHLRDYAFKTGAMQKMCICNRAAMSAVNSAVQGASQIWIEPGDIPQFGINVRKWHSSWGDILFVQSDSIRETKEMFIFFEPDKWKARVLQSTHLKQDIQETNRMAVANSIITELGWQYGLEKTGSILKGT